MPTDNMSQAYGAGMTQTSDPWVPVDPTWPPLGSLGAYPWFLPTSATDAHLAVAIRGRGAEAHRQGDTVLAEALTVAWNLLSERAAKPLEKP